MDKNLYNVPTLTRVKRGNALERAILGVCGFKTEKVVHSYECREGPAPASEVQVDGAAIEIRVYGRSYCLQTDAATLVARR